MPEVNRTRKGNGLSHHIDHVYEERGITRETPGDDTARKAEQYLNRNGSRSDTNWPLLAGAAGAFAVGFALGRNAGVAAGAAAIAAHAMAGKAAPPARDRRARDLSRSAAQTARRAAFTAGHTARIGAAGAGHAARIGAASAGHAAAQAARSGAEFAAHAARTGADVVVPAVKAGAETAGHALATGAHVAGHAARTGVTAAGHAGGIFAHKVADTAVSAARPALRGVGSGLISAGTSLRAANTPAPRSRWPLWAAMIGLLGAGTVAVASRAR